MNTKPEKADEEKILSQKEIRSRLTELEDLLSEGEFQEIIDNCEKILKQDPGNKRAIYLKKEARIGLSEEQLRSNKPLISIPKFFSKHQKGVEESKAESKKKEGEKKEEEDEEKIDFKKIEINENEFKEDTKRERVDFLLEKIEIFYDEQDFENDQILTLIHEVLDIDHSNKKARKLLKFIRKNIAKQRKLEEKNELKKLAAIRSQKTAEYLEKIGPALDNNEYSVAISICEEALEQDPDNKNIKKILTKTRNLLDKREDEKKKEEERKKKEELDKQKLLKKLYDQAIKMHKNRNNRRALEYLYKVLVLDPGNQPATHLLEKLEKLEIKEDELKIKARTFLKTKQFEQLKETCQEILDIDEESKTAKRFLAEAEKGIDKRKKDEIDSEQKKRDIKEKSERDYEDFIHKEEFKKMNSKIRDKILEVKLLFDKRDYFRAIQVCTEILKMDSRNFIAQKFLMEAERVIELRENESEQLSQASSMSNAIKRMRRLIKIGEFKRVFLGCAEILQSDPTNKEAAELMKEARIQIERRKHQKEIIDFKLEMGKKKIEEKLETDKNKIGSLMEKAKELREEGKLEESQKVLRDILSIDFEFKEARDMMTKTQEIIIKRKDLLDKAKKALKFREVNKAKKLTEELKEILPNDTELLKLEKSLEKEGEKVAELVAKGKDLTEKKHIEKALKVLYKALEMEPGNPSVITLIDRLSDAKIKKTHLVKKAKVHKENGNHEEVVKICNELQKIDHHDPLTKKLAEHAQNKIQQEKLQNTMEQKKKQQEFEIDKKKDERWERFTNSHIGRFFTKMKLIKPDRERNRLRKKRRKSRKKAKNKVDWFMLFARLSRKERTFFFTQLAILLSSDINLMDSLNIMEKQTQTKTLKKILQLIMLNISKGKLLSESMAMFAKIFPPIYTSLVNAGEKSGALVKILRELSSQMEEQNKLLGKIKGAMIYPVVVMSLAMAMVSGILILIVPKLAKMYAEAHMELPFMTKLVMGASKMLAEKGHIALAVFIVIGIAIKIFVAKTDAGKFMMDKFVFGLPIFGKIAKNKNIIVFTGNFALLIGNGVLITDAFDIVKDAMSSIYYQKEIQIMKEGVIQGKAISEMMGLLNLQTGEYKENKFFPLNIAQMIVVGEQTGNLDKMLNKIKENYARETTDTVAVMSSLMEPIMIVGIGSMVGFLLLAIMLPFFNMSKVAKGG